MKTDIKKKNHPNILLARVIAVILFIAVVAGTWDAWWHGAIGRDTFWEPPHLLLYSSIMGSVILGLYGWRKTKERNWRNQAMVLSLILVAAPFDELWHRTFGVEDLSSPLIVWSPPHLAIIAVLIASMIMVLPLLRKDKEEYQFLFGTMLFAAIANVMLFLTSPLIPEGPWHLLGFWGTIVPSFVLIAVLSSAKRWLRRPGAVLLTSAFFITISAISFNERIAEGVSILPHEHVPPFLTIFAILSSAFILEFNGHTILRGILAGAVWAGVVYGFAWWFFAPEFQYGLIDGIIALVSGTAGGFLGSVTISKFLMRGIEKKTK